MRSSLLLAATLIARGAPPAVSPNVVALAPVVSAGPPAAAAPVQCTIAGSGELRAEWDEGTELGLFESPRATKAEVIVAKTTDVHVVWSELPSTHAERRLAAVRLGGDAHLTVTAYAKLDDRRFQLRSRGAVAGEHAWIDQGVAVEVLGVALDGVVVRRKSPFSSPTFFEATVPCGIVAYEPTSLDAPGDDEWMDDDEYVAPRGDKLELHRSIDGGIAYVVEPGEAELSLVTTETSGDWLRVRWHEDGLGLDGWVKKTETVEGYAHGTGRMGGGSAYGHGRPRRTSTVTHPTPLLLGADHHQFADADFEKDAVLDVWREEDGLLQVTFHDDAIVTSDGEMWISAKAVSP